MNRGIEAQTAVQAAGRFNHHVTPLQPEVLVMQAGVNDLRLIPLFPGQRTAIIANCLTSIRSIVDEASALGTTVVLTTIFPLGQAPLDKRIDGSAAEVAAAIDEVNGFIWTLAAENVIIFDAAAVLADENGTIRPEYDQDFLHINEVGYEALNDELTRILMEE